MIEVVVVKAPSEPVVTITTPDSVSGFPLASAVVKVVVNVVNGCGITEVVVVNEPFSSVVTITTPDSVSGFPLASVVVKVVVNVVKG